MLLDNYQHLVLLDLGVLRPVGQPGVTDADGIRSFVGTLQYSSPEFLLRQEEDTLEGWRALTFYQIGGVIHDLLMRRALFQDFTDPYARLVNAVQHEAPVLYSTTAPPYLVDVAKRCLLKDPKLRNRLLQWRDFTAPNAPKISAKDKLSKRLALARAVQEDATTAQPPAASADLKWTIIEYLKVATRSIRGSEGMLPPVTTTAYRHDGSGLCLEFGASKMYHLPAPLFIYTVVETLDLTSKVIAVRGRAAIDSTEPDFPDVNCTIFEGVYDGAMLYNRFEDFIYGAFLWAQDVDRGSTSAPLWPIRDVT